MLCLAVRAIRSVNHVLDFIYGRRVSPDHFLQIAHTKVQPDGHGKYIDDLLCMRAKKMGADDPLRTLICQQLETRMSDSYSAR